jgi:hemerythrin-like domain-containing protein
MHPLLEELHQDHLNLARVLRLLEGNLAGVRAGEHIDLNALGEIVDYVEIYPDRFHHPRENVIFSAYLERRGGRFDLFERLTVEHTRLASKTREIREHIQEWSQDSPVPRERIVAIIADYLRLQWNHLNLEEDSAFGVLDLELTAGDWERVEASAPAASDPLFGNLSRQRFAGIFGQLGL